MNAPSLLAGIAVAALGCRAPQTGLRSPEPALSSSPAPAAATLRILALGDSITQADSSHLSYRYRLWERLRAAGIAFDFVGSQQTHWRGTPSYPDPGFDRDHEGHWGWRVDQLRAGLADWLQSYTPDVVLLHAGTNDVFQGEPAASIVAELEDLATLLIADQPSVVVLVARLIPTADAAVNREIAAVNAAIDQLPARVAAVTLVDQFSGFDPARHSDDGIHPNAAGEELIADRWLTAIRAVTASRRVPSASSPAR